MSVIEFYSYTKSEKAFRSNSGHVQEEVINLLFPVIKPAKHRAMYKFQEFDPI